MIQYDGGGDRAHADRTIVSTSRLQGSLPAVLTGSLVCIEPLFITMVGYKFEDQQMLQTSDSF